MESADFIEISDYSDINIDKNDYNASGYQNDSQIYTRPNTPAEGSTVPNTSISNSTDNMVFTVIPDWQSQSSESSILNSLAINTLHKHLLQHMHTSSPLARRVSTLSRIGTTRQVSTPSRQLMHKIASCSTKGKGCDTSTPTCKTRNSEVETSSTRIQPLRCSQ